MIPGETRAKISPNPAMSAFKRTPDSSRTLRRFRKTGRRNDRPSGPKPSDNGRTPNGQVPTRHRERAPLPGAAQFIDPFFHLRGRSQPCALQLRYREADSTSVDGRLSYRPQSAKVPADVE
jgi:hypothetical protein